MNGCTLLKSSHKISLPCTLGRTLRNFFSFVIFLLVRKGGKGVSCCSKKSCLLKNFRFSTKSSCHENNNKTVLNVV